MTNAPQPYIMNYGWVWGPENPNLDKVARLALAIRRADPEQLDALLERWLGTLTYDGEPGHYIQGGFSVAILARGAGTADILLTSGGQDVADSLGFAVDSIYEQVLQHLEPADVRWSELPLL